MSSSKMFCRNVSNFLLHVLSFRIFKCSGMLFRSPPNSEDILSLVISWYTWVKVEFFFKSSSLAASWNLWFAYTSNGIFNLQLIALLSMRLLPMMKFTSNINLPNTSGTNSRYEICSSEFCVVSSSNSDNVKQNDWCPRRLVNRSVISNATWCNSEVIWLSHFSAKWLGSSRSRFDTTRRVRFAK